MKAIIIISFLLIISAESLFGQARIVINNDGFIVIDDSAKIVIENSATNALATTGTGGNIMSEHEADMIIWEVGTSTGVYSVPWTTTSTAQGGNGTKIPLEVNITGAGTGTGSLNLSTYETSTDANAPYPALVTHMNAESGGDGSLLVVDRFWHIAANNYSAKPNVTMTISYDASANEIGGTNTLSEPNLIAQRWNSDLGGWQGNTFGTNDAANDRVTSIIASSADFYENWTLVDVSSPLPVSLVSFDASCEDGNVRLSWATASEFNNDYFRIEKSYDAENFTYFATISGSGFSNSMIDYETWDQELREAYYSLTQVDFDGTEEKHGVVSVDCGIDKEVIQAFFDHESLVLDIHSIYNGRIDVHLFDNSGRLVYAQSGLNVMKGDNQFKVEDEFVNGVYHLQVLGEKTAWSKKLCKVRY